MAGIAEAPSSGQPLSMTYLTPQPQVAMSEQHYERIQERIRREVRGTHTSSIWLALGLAVAGVGATLLVTISSATLSAAAKGKLEVAAWACLVVTLIFMVFHFVMWHDAKNRADDVISEMDTYNYRRAEDEGSAGRASGRLATGAALRAKSPAR